MQEMKIKIGNREYTLNNNSDKYDRAKADAGGNATDKQILAHYDKLAGLIRDENGKKIENGPFWEAEKKRIADEPRQLKHKTGEELKEIMRSSIDNQHIPSSIYHKAKQELEFRKMEETIPIRDADQISLLKKYRDEIIIGIIVTVAGGIILSILL